MEDLEVFDPLVCDSTVICSHFEQIFSCTFKSISQIFHQFLSIDSYWKFLVIHFIHLFVEVLHVRILKVIVAVEKVIQYTKVHPNHVVDFEKSDFVPRYLENNVEKESRNIMIEEEANFEPKLILHKVDGRIPQHSLQRKFIASYFH